MSNNKDPKTQSDPPPLKKETTNGSTTKEKDIRQSLNTSKKDNFGNSQKADSSRWNTAKKDARDKRLLQVMITNIMVCSSLLKKSLEREGSRVIKNQNMYPQLFQNQTARAEFLCSGPGNLIGTHAASSKPQPLSLR